MDDDLKFLEAELNALVPATPPARLQQRIATELGASRAEACSREQGYDGPGRFARESKDRAILPWWRLAVLPLAAAAAFAAVLALGNRPALAPASEVAAESPGNRSETWPQGSGAEVDDAGAQLKPIHVENVLYEQTEEEVITANGASARRERLRYVDTITWQNPRTRASLTWSVPREEVRVVPINYQ